MGGPSPKEIAYVLNARTLDGHKNPVRMSDTEENAIKENIVYMFENRHVFDPGRVVAPFTYIDTVEFNWGVVR
jgi:hypothetical protein